MDSRLEALRGRHRALDAVLAEELARPAPDLMRVRQLKRDKLALKDAMARRAVRESPLRA